jgi:hypothetical protein
MRKKIKYSKMIKLKEKGPQCKRQRKYVINLKVFIFQFVEFERWKRDSQKKNKGKRKLLASYILTIKKDDLCINGFLFLRGGSCPFKHDRKSVLGVVWYILIQLIFIF